MEDFNINSTSQDKTYNNGNITSNYYVYSNITSDYYDDYYKELYFIMYVGTCMVIAIGLPLTLYALYSLVGTL